MAAPPPATAPYTPNARARSRSSVKATLSSDSDAGAITAANVRVLRDGLRPAPPA